MLIFCIISFLAHKSKEDLHHSVASYVVLILTSNLKTNSLVQ